MRVILSLFCLFSFVLGEKMEIFVIINEQKLKAVLAENSSALALYKELEKGDIIINAKDYGNIPHGRERIYIVAFRSKTLYQKLLFHIIWPYITCGVIFWLITVFAFIVITCIIIIRIFSKINIIFIK